MHLYLSQRPIHPLQVTHILNTVANLYRLNILTDNSKVWARVGDFNNQVWALTDRSSCIKYHVAQRPGCARITQTKLRWAPTSDESQTNPHIEFYYSELPDTHTQRFTLVVDHCAPEDRNVSIIESSSSKDSSDGTYRSNETGVQVIDANAYYGAKVIWKDPDGNESFDKTPGAKSYYGDVSEYEKSHATIFGVDYMSQHLTKAEANALRKNPDKYRIDLSHTALEQISAAAFGGMEKIANTVLRELVDREGEDTSAQPEEVILET